VRDKLVSPENEQKKAGRLPTWFARPSRSTDLKNNAIIVASGRFKEKRRRISRISYVTIFPQLRKIKRRTHETFTSKHSSHQSL
jgi:hypothetical protein